MIEQTASTIIKALGEEALEKNLGMTPRAIRHAKSTGKFSGLWWPEIRNLCVSHGVYCSETAFTWKSAAKNNGDQISEQVVQKAMPTTG